MISGAAEAAADAVVVHGYQAPWTGLAVGIGKGRVAVHQRERLGVPDVHASPGPYRQGPKDVGAVLPAGLAAAVEKGVPVPVLVQLEGSQASPAMVVAG